MDGIRICSKATADYGVQVSTRERERQNTALSLQCCCRSCQRLMPLLAVLLQDGVGDLYKLTLGANTRTSLMSLGGVQLTRSICSRLSAWACVCFFLCRGRLPLLLAGRLPHQRGDGR